jgi:hypothetical protein
VIVKKTLLVQSQAWSHPDPALIPETTQKNLATTPVSANTDPLSATPIAQIMPWQPNRRRCRHCSVFPYLEGELEIEFGNMTVAREKFQQSRKIDEQLSDKDGIIKNDERLLLLG